MIRLFKVVARLASPVVVQTPLHLDAILHARHPAMHWKGKVTRLDSRNEILAPIPVARFGFTCGKWGLCASAMMVPDEIDVCSATITKRRDPWDKHLLVGSYQPGSGAMRDRKVDAVSLATPVAWWLVASDDPGEIRRILRRVQSVGGWTKSGYGAVLEWMVEEEGGEPFDAVWAKGHALRRIPLSLCEGEGRSMRCHPPYWSQTGWVEAVEAGESCVLRPGLQCW